MKPRYLVSVFLIAGLVSGCVANSTPRGYWGWSDQKKMTHQNPWNSRGYSGPHRISATYGVLGPSGLHRSRKVLEGTYKDGKWEGLWTGWHSENGQKMFEGTYIDGTKIIARYWNIEGIEVENLDEAQGYADAKEENRY